MKELIGIEKQVGEDAQLKAAIGIKDANFRVEVSAEYPVAKVIEPATKALDSLLDKLERAIPGSWDKPIIEKIKEEYKEELLKLISQ